MSTLVKICGINSAEAADATVRAGADLGGLVFHPKSPRHLTLEAGRALAGRMRGRLRLVALVADADDADIAAIAQAVRPVYLQLHGNETPERTGQIRSRFGLPVIKAISIAEPADFAAVPEYEIAADILLFDAKAPDGAPRPGGHGAAFDWQLLRGRSFSHPWLLAGGLTPQNVARAVASAGAPGVDVSSGVETAPGVKSPQLIADFVFAARKVQFAEAP
ncbi:MAG: phosphoribosylanthranilate isomerase [Alphaproteobacteria bacterium]|nr:phosphoribosylanthranilate isomerase [Alphaproteobacteria bacterium]MDE2110898.1 phosphoribosylanthranilate isomerase [Alphaproteobacteria bacterium]MDE2494127.1 phosphoribosylanthranilate isomerase [Alphaproteobacteria bacterium]